MADPRLASILDRTGHPETVAWAHEGKGDVATLPDPELAIAAAGALGNVAALQSVQAPKALRKAASAALHKLKSRGVKVEETVAPRAFVLEKETFDLPCRAFLSRPDLEGDVELLLTASNPDGTCALGIIFGGGGVKEARHAHVGRSELRNVWKSVEGNPSTVEIPFVAGLALAEPRVTVSEHAHDWKHFLTHVAPATLQSARVLDPLHGAPAATEGGPDSWLAPLSVMGADALRAGEAEVYALVQAGGVGEDHTARIEEIAARVADAALETGDRAALGRAAEIVAASYTWHGHRAAAELVLAEAGAALGGAAGSTLQGVRDIVKYFLLSASTQALRGRMAEMTQQIAELEKPGEDEEASE